MNKQLKKEVLEKKMPGRGRPGFDVTDASAAQQFRSFASEVEFNRKANSPLWVQLRNQLEAAISGKILEANSRLPSEQAMCDMFALSRPVVRNALSALVAEGLIVKQPRKGIFVGSQQKEFGFMTSPLGVFDDLSARGFNVSETTYEFSLHEANAEEQKALKLPDGFKVIRFVRVYSADGQPITYSKISLPAHRLPGMENIDMENRSIFETIRETFGLTVSRADRWISSKNADELVSDRLNVRVGKALIHIQSIAYDYENIPLEFYTAFYNDDVAPIHIATDS